jgi:hypothetical protein
MGRGQRLAGLIKNQTVLQRHGGNICFAILLIASRLGMDPHKTKQGSWGAFGHKSKDQQKLART